MSSGEAEGEFKARDPPAGLFERHPSKPHISSFDEYKKIYKESVESPDTFWGKTAREILSWDRDFQTVQHGTLGNGDVSFFPEGRLNACFNCVDRHAFKNPEKTALIWEADEPGEGHSLTYAELLREVSQLAHYLTKIGVKKGDTVAIYMPMCLEAVIAFLGVVRCAGVHSAVFAGFSSESLRDRIVDANSRVVLTTDEGRRGGKTIHTKKIVDEALKQCPSVTNVLVFKRTGADIPWTEKRDFWWGEELAKQPRYFPPVSVASEDPLFILYTSGSTGKPKGVVHSTAGYILGAALTTKWSFDVHEDDVVYTAADLGWITGHSYCIYGPLALGATSIIFESTPAYPTFSRYFEVIDKYNVTHFYLAPTALRLLKKAGDKFVTLKGDKLRVLGSVGEPIAPEIWHWYETVIGKGKAHIVDTYWQTETGSHVLTPLAGVSPTKPGSASFPFPGINPAILDPVSGEELQGNNVEGVLCFKQPWPSMIRSIWGDHARMIDVYLKPYPGYYFTGDGVRRDADGFYFIKGRVDDVANVSGHRISTAEIEAALLEHPSVAEAACAAIPDEITGQAINAFVSLKEGFDSSPELRKELTLQVRKSIGPFAAPKVVYIVDDLPKTRSGKIMRRILRKILTNETDSLGDTSTLSEPGVVDKIIKTVEESRKA